jgi:hypothetical protein
LFAIPFAVGMLALEELRKWLVKRRVAAREDDAGKREWEGARSMTPAQLRGWLPP